MEPSWPPTSLDVLAWMATMVDGQSNAPGALGALGAFGAFGPLGAIARSNQATALLAPDDGRVVWANHAFVALAHAVKAHRRLSATAAGMELSSSMVRLHTPDGDRIMLSVEPVPSARPQTRPTPSMPAVPAIPAIPAADCVDTETRVATNNSFFGVRQLWRQYGSKPVSRDGMRRYYYKCFDESCGARLTVDQSPTGSRVCSQAVGFHNHEFRVLDRLDRPDRPASRVQRRPATRRPAPQLPAACPPLAGLTARVAPRVTPYTIPRVVPRIVPCLALCSSA